MKSVLILGVGGTGSRAVNMLQKKIRRMGMQEDAKIISIVLDTNLADEKNMDAATVVSLSANATVKMVRERLGSAVCDDFFPKDEKFDTNDLSIGAGQWRKQSFLAFLNAMSSSQHTDLEQAVEELADKTSDSNEVTIYTVASLAGGTGSGSFIPLALYVKKLLRAKFGPKLKIKSRAMLACPDIYEAKQNGDHMNITKIYANAYAILRELNAINQVVYGANSKDYDKGDGEIAALGRTPIRFHIGTAAHTPVGVLFDSEEKERDPETGKEKLKYGSTECAPFNTVFLMEKILGVASIEAHDEAMANILYSVICTKAGAELDSIWSNQEAARANRTGHNRLFAGIGSSEIQYPVEEIIEYFARRKTQADAEGEWLTLHNATKAQIDEKARLAKEMRKEYHWTEKDYAKFFIDAREAEASTETSNITEMLDAATIRVVEKNDEVEKIDILAAYWKKAKECVADLIPDCGELAKRISSIKPVENPGMFASRSDKEAKPRMVCDNAKKIYNMLNDYYHEAVDLINSRLNVTTDAILAMDPKKDPLANAELSFAVNVLKSENYFLHPVAAMLQLCRFRLLLQEELAAMEGNVWKDVGAYQIGDLSAELMECSANLATLGLGNKTAKSAYLKGGKNRFASILERAGADSYKSDKSDYEVDSAAILKDADMILTRLNTEAGEMLLRRVIEKLCERVDAMMKSYRTFFTRFSEQKKELKNKVEKAEAEKAESGNSACVYVGSSIEARRRHYDRMMEENVADSREGNDVAGKSVFAIAYQMSCSRLGKSEGEETVDASGVFEAMYQANLAQLAKNGYCIGLRKKNVLQVIAEENGAKAKEAGKSLLQTAYAMAQAALKIDARGEGENAPKNQAILLAPQTVEDWLQEEGSVFGIAPSANCTSEIISKWCPEANVRIEDSVPKNTLFLCRVLMSVDPTEIVKVNEKSGDDGYYKRYLEAIRIAEKEGNDAMFPHLGFNWHKRDRLPLINSDLNVAADKKMVKALLFAIMEGEIEFTAPYGDMAFRYANEKIAGNGRFADEKNLLGLIEWLRPQDALIERWCADFDRKIEDQLAELPNAGFVSDVGAGKTALTMTPYLKQLRTNIFSTMAAHADGRAKSVLEENLNLSVIEFAKRIKTQEEGANGFDCNDAEKIVRVASELLWDLCERVVSSEQDAFKEVYQWELDYFVAELCVDKDFNNAKALEKARNLDEAIECINTSNVKELLHFAARAGAFLEIDFSKTVGAGSKWDKFEFRLNDFLRERRDRIRKVLEFHGITFKKPEAALADTPAAEAPVAEAPAASSETSTEG